MEGGRERKKERREKDGWIDRQMDRQIDRQTEKSIDRLILFGTTISHSGSIPRTEVWSKVIDDVTGSGQQ